MTRLDIPGNVVEVLLGGIRRPSSVRPLRAANHAFEALPSAIRKTPVATHQLQGIDWAVGRTLADTDLHAATGALILAIRRGANAMTSPSSDVHLKQGDVLYLVGDDSDILLARQRLTSGPS